VALTDEAIQQIKEMILDGRLKPGDRLPREADLAESLGLSRGSLREAVRGLSMMRILDVRRGDGTYVTSLEPALLLETMNFVVDFHQDASVLHLFEVRRALEPAAAEMAARVLTAEQAAGLDANVDALTDDLDIEAIVANDIEFHHLIGVASGNPVLCSLIDSVGGRTQRARIWRGVTQTDALERTRREHRALATAIQQGRPDVARAWAIAHIAGVEDWLRTSLGERPTTIPTGIPTEIKPEPNGTGSESQ
jgi:GntR family transcriptional repressor for pyruvate dehydrogenase complex